ncbi:[FeFe] hydrogenase H-cluster maturation GTPase HydF [Cloacibacillus evryensis]|uniref:[FeFe] hydrogenase H-cluster maturation GTPase HydF n=1 Tax=Cloacibacillus evryensis TaxID=508460 RepID=UPI0021090D67|nr:[FeFe] hydrogenase H-cluster maturation GTPase HydF [Cloacibacillus evryensis]MCQ4764130.1 [FeFe] hydrogenase H-cluster maturation GTPase HydF [Cloacibacillus evryensis]
MALMETPRSNRLHIAFYGRRNAGKSSLINMVTAQRTALVSEHAGTTTDPVIKSMELLPLGPIAVIDTAGLDDTGELGALRIERSKEMMDRTDLALLVIAADETADLSFEKEWLEELRARKTTVIGVMNQIDRLDAAEIEPRRAALEAALGIPFTAVSATDKGYRAALLSAIVKNAPTDFESPTLTGDLFKPGEAVVLVAPQDIQAPKGRLILPQVQVIRDILDNKGMALTCTADQLPGMLAALREPPALVITDSQVFARVNALLPRTVPLTSFSIIMARSKGELSAFVEGAKAIEKLKPSDKVLIAEACTHAPLNEDIGREKLPRWLRERAGGSLTAEIATGLDFPKNLKEYALILHCGGCMFTRKQLMSRIIEAQEAGVPITNYGVAIAQLNGILERVTEMFAKR